MKKDRVFEIALNMVNIDKREHWEGLETREFFVMLLICYAVEKQDVISLFDIKGYNKRYSHSLTSIAVKGLTGKGYVKTIRSKAYFSKAYIELTDKGLLFKSKMFRLLNKKL